MDNFAIKKLDTCAIYKMELSRKYLTAYRLIIKRAIKITDKLVLEMEHSVKGYEV
jgi:hypothetical protein